MRLLSCIYVKIFDTRGFFFMWATTAIHGSPLQQCYWSALQLQDNNQKYGSLLPSFTILSFRCAKYISLFRIYPANIYLFKVTNRNIRKRCEICSKLIIKTPMLIVKMEQLLQPLYCHYIFIITILLPFFSPLFLVWQFVPLQKIKTKKQKECVETGPLKEQIATMISKYFNQFVSNAPFLYPLKTSDNRKVY